MQQTTANAHAVFMAAVSYMSASKDLRRRSSPLIQQHALPSIQLSFIAVELFLKCLIALNNGEIRTGHELHKLLRRLPDSISEELSVRWGKRFADGPYLKLPREMLAKLPPTVNLYSVLRSANFMQQQSRYPWERKGNLNVFIIQDVPDMLYTYICEVRPDWELPEGPAAI